MTSIRNEKWKSRILKEPLVVTRSELKRFLKTPDAKGRLHTAFILVVERTKYADGKVTLTFPYEQRYLK